MLKLKKIIKAIEDNKDKFQFNKHFYATDNARCTLGLLLEASGLSPRSKKEGDGTVWECYYIDEIHQKLKEYGIPEPICGDTSDEWRWLTKLNDYACNDWDCVLEELKKPELRKIAVKIPALYRDEDGELKEKPQGLYAPEIDPNE